jgi:hypothetical protein
MAVVTHTQRSIMEAIEVLTELEEALRGKVANPGLAARLDGMIEELSRLVVQVGRDTPGAAKDAATLQAVREDEKQRRGVAQQNADRCP